MNTHHTPGPWSIQADDLDSFTIYSEQMNIAEVLAIGGEGMSDEGEANTRLIAAAPELLEALQTTQDAIHAVLSLPAHEPASVVLLIRQLMEAKGKANEAIRKATQP